MSIVFDDFVGGESTVLTGELNAKFNALKAGVNATGTIRTEGLPYDSTLTYEVNDLVTHGGSAWRSKVDANLDHTPAAGAWWEVFVAKGDTGPAGPTGPAGADGDDGADGVGVPTGGTTGQVLAKNSNTDHDTEWVDQSGGVTDHGALTGLADDDHTHYHNDTRGDARYARPNVDNQFSTSQRITGSVALGSGTAPVLGGFTGSSNLSIKSTGVTNAEVWSTADTDANFFARNSVQGWAWGVLTGGNFAFTELGVASRFFIDRQGSIRFAHQAASLAAFILKHAASPTAPLQSNRTSADVAKSETAKSFHHEFLDLLLGIIFLAGSNRRNMRINSADKVIVESIDSSNNSTGTVATLASEAYVDAPPAYTALTDGATVTWTVSKPKSKAKVTLGGNRTLAFSGIANGMEGVLIVTQDGTGGRSLTLPAASKTAGGAGITLSTGAGAMDVLCWEYDGTNYFWTIAKDWS